jgi:hypothetical protein
MMQTCLQFCSIKEWIMINHRFIGFCLAAILVLISLPQLLWAQDVTLTPSLRLTTLYDDNLDFEQKNEKDSFGANAVPGLTLDYASELLQFSLVGEVDVIKYFTETDFDRTNQLYGIDGQYQMSPRWRFTGDFEYRRDETIDTVLEETGQAFERRRVETYDGGAGLFYQITELSDIGFETDYRKREYSSDNDTDFDRYTFSLPYSKRFSNQRWYLPTAFLIQMVQKTEKITALKFDGNARLVKRSHPLSMRAVDIQILIKRTARAILIGAMSVKWACAK